MTLALDTHVWLKWLVQPESLARAECTALGVEAERSGLFLPAICLWEAQMLHAKGRVELPLPFGEWLRRATDPRIVSLIPLDADVVVALDALPRSFHGDPADRLIVASARAHALPLATHDRTIRRSRTVRIWRP